MTKTLAITIIIPNLMPKFGHCNFINKHLHNNCTLAANASFVNANHDKPTNAFYKPIYTSSYTFQCLWNYGTVSVC